MKFCLLFISLFVLFSCSEKTDSSDITNKDILLPKIPDYFPEYTIPEDNLLTKERVVLGEKLFFSKLLSRDNSMSCGSCHLPEVAFANNEKTTAGVFGREGTRNVPTLLNILFHDKFLREGSVPTLEQQILVPVQEHNEFDNDWLTIQERFNSDDEFLELLDKCDYIFPADGKKIEKFNPYSITRAISAFQRTLVSVNSKYDKYLQNKLNLTTSENLGQSLFKSDSLNCSKCHSGALFTNLDYYNNGLYEQYQDIGRARFTHNDEDIGRFKVPSLRNVALTFPYMFDGSIPTLDDVISHYESGGKEHPNKSSILKKFKLNATERTALINFLKTLSEE